MYTYVAFEFQSDRLPLKNTSLMALILNTDVKLLADDLCIVVLIFIFLFGRIIEVISLWVNADQPISSTVSGISNYLNFENANA